MAQKELKYNLQEVLAQQFSVTTYVYPKLITISKRMKSDYKRTILISLIMYRPTIYYKESR